MDTEVNSIISMLGPTTPQNIHRVLVKALCTYKRSHFLYLYISRGPEFLEFSCLLKQNRILILSCLSLYRKDGWEKRQRWLRSTEGWTHAWPSLSLSSGSHLPHSFNHYMPLMPNVYPTLLVWQSLCKCPCAVTSILNCLSSNLLCLCKHYLVLGFMPGSQHQGKTCTFLPASLWHSSVTMFVFPPLQRILVRSASVLLSSLPSVLCLQTDHTSVLRDQHSCSAQSIFKCCFNWLLIL